MTSELYLEMVSVEIATQLQADLEKLEHSDDTHNALEDAHKQAFTVGALVTILSLLGHKFKASHATPRALKPDNPRSFTTGATTALQARGVQFSLTNPKVLAKLAKQAQVANTALQTARVSGRFAIGANTRAAGFAARWGAQHGANAAASNSSLVTANGIAVQAFKTWCRSFPRKENRVWHDALNGVSIPQDQKFRLQTPKYGLLEIDFPYDGLAPWSEWIHCGHSIRYEAPQGAIVNPWSGGTVQLSASKWAQDQETELTLEQTTAVELAVNEAGLSQFLTAKPLQRLNFTNVKTGDFGADSSAGWTAPPEFVQLKQSYPWIVVKPVTRMDKLPLGNETLRPGLSPGVAVMDKGTLGFMKGVFVHELGHHVIYEAGIEIEQLIKNAYGIGKPITQYASANYHEYFCESLAAYTYYRKELQKYDLVGYNLVQEVLKRLR